jgi:Fe-coproporphyrin III synthase
LINLTRLWAGVATPGDGLRYGEKTKGSAPPRQKKVHHRPIVVWNITRGCNLACAHCYISAKRAPDPMELTTSEAKGVADQLADYGVPVVLFSGGEPLVREDLLEVASYAKSKGLRLGLSTNGTLLTRIKVREVMSAGFSYAGISIDGPEVINDKFRGAKGAYEDALMGIRNSLAEGLRVSLRFTLTRYNHQYLDEIFELVEREGIPRVCIYHLGYSGRGEKISERASLTSDETRVAMERCMEWSDRFAQKGLDVEVLTVNNHADSPYLLMRLAEQRPDRVEESARLLALNGGNSSGVGISSIAPLGTVHPDQFSHALTLGNVRTRPFGDIWEDTTNPKMFCLKATPRALLGRCGRCPVLPLCNGNSRARAFADTGSYWESDPACYLTANELDRVAEITVAS